MTARSDVRVGFRCANVERKYILHKYLRRSKRLTRSSVSHAARLLYDRKKSKKMEMESRSPACGLIERLGNRWTLLVLFTLRERGTLRFGELARAVPGGISERMLAAVLRDLEETGLIGRTAYAEVPPRVEYRLTERGASLLPLLDALVAWAERSL